MKRPAYVLVAACVAFGLFGALYAFGAIEPDTDAGPLAERQVTEYEVYWLGTSFDGLKLTARIRRLERPAVGERFGADFSSYLYGACTPRGIDGGCPYPVEVQSWAACKRNRSVYSLTPDGTPLPRRNTTIRGVPAAFFEDGARLEVYTGKTTVVIFGSSAPRLTRAANAMRSVSGRVPPAKRLPSPAPGALEGKLRC